MSHPGSLVDLCESAFIQNSPLLLGHLSRWEWRQATCAATQRILQLHALISASPGCQECLIRLVRRAWKLDARPYHPEARRRVRSRPARIERCLLPAHRILSEAATGQ